MFLNLFKNAKNLNLDKPIVFEGKRRFNVFGVYGINCYVETKLC